MLLKLFVFTCHVPSKSSKLLQVGSCEVTFTPKKLKEANHQQVFTGHSRSSYMQRPLFREPECCVINIINYTNIVSLDAHLY